MKIDEFLKDSINLIDSEDVNREMSNCNYKFTKDLLNKDIDIAKEDKKITCIKRDKSDLLEKNISLKNKLNQILDSLS